MNKFLVSLLRQLHGCMQDGLSIRVTAQKLGISKSSVSFLSQTALSYGGIAKWANCPTRSYWRRFTRRQRRRTKNQTGWKFTKNWPVGMSRSNGCTTPISHKSSDAHTPTLPFVAVTESGGKPTATAYPTVTSKSSPVRAWRLTSPATTSSGLILTVTYNVRGCLSRCCRTATSPTLRPFPMRSNRAGSPASFTLSNTSAHAAGPRHGQCKGTRQALELVRGRSAADGALPVQLL